MILAIILLQKYAVNALSTSMFMSVLAFIYDLVLFQYCFAIVFYFLSFEKPVGYNTHIIKHSLCLSISVDDLDVFQSRGDNSWYQQLYLDCAKKNVQKTVIDCDTLRKHRATLSFYFVVTTVTTTGFGDIVCKKTTERVSFCPSSNKAMKCD